MLFLYLFFTFSALNNFSIAYSFLFIYFSYFSFYLRHSNRRFFMFAKPFISRSKIMPHTNCLTPRLPMFFTHTIRISAWVAGGWRIISYRDSPGKLTSINHIADECRLPRSLPLTFVTFYYNAFIRSNVHAARLRDIFHKKTTRLRGRKS